MKNALFLQHGVSGQMTNQLREFSSETMDFQFQFYDKKKSLLQGMT